MLKTSEYVGIKSGALHEHTEISEYYCARCGHPVTDHDSYCRECGGAFQRSFATEQCDRDALIKLANEMEQELGSVCGVCMGKTARRIRKALGVKEGMFNA